MIGETAELAVKLKLEDRQFQSSIAKDERSLRNLNTTVGKTGSAFTNAARNIGGFQKNMGNAFNNVGRGAANAARNIQRLAFIAGTLAVGAGVAAVKWAGDFEAQLRTINTIARETPEGLSRIGDSIREIARETGTPLEELTQGYYDLLSAGIKAADAQNVLTNANKLAIGGLASAAETVDLLTTAINVYGGDATKAAQFTDEFAASIERGKVTAAELAGSYAQVAPLAASLNIENKELAAGYARLTAAGTPAAEAATQMASAMTALLKKTPDLEKLEKQTGKNYAALAGDKGFNVALEQMRVDAEKAGIDLVKLVGRKEALLYILQTTGPNMKAYNADLAAMGDAAGTAAEQMAERQQGLNFQLAKLKAGIKDAGIEIGSALIPKLVPLIERFNAFLKNNREGIKRFGQDIANAFEQVVKFASKIDFRQIGDSLKVAATFGKALIQAFLSAPQWLQTAVITGWGLNKLTGGAVQNIMADLTKATIGGVFSQFVVRGSSPANPMFVSDVTGGLGGGVLGKGGGVLGKVGLAAAAVIPVVAIKESGILEQITSGINRFLFGDETAAGIDKFNQSIKDKQAGITSPKQDQAKPEVFGTAVADAFRRTVSTAAALEEHRRREWGTEIGSAVTVVGSAVTEMRHVLHADLQQAIKNLDSDEVHMRDALAGILAAVKGGAGSGKTTEAIIADLMARRDATQQPALIKMYTDAIAKLEPFAKGRQWQAEQIAAAEKIRSSNKTTADKVTALKGIQQDLLSHNRTMAAGIVGGLADVVAAVQNIKLPHAPGRGPLEFDEGPTGPIIPRKTPLPHAPGRGPLVSEGSIVKVTSSIKDTNNAQDTRLRWGKTPTQVGAA
jgi:TP901 family phage tail tape measure protein